jgi:hypothetical protein
VWEDTAIESAVLLKKSDFQKGLPALVQDFSRASFKKLLHESIAGDRDIGLLFV